MADKYRFKCNFCNKVFVKGLRKNQCEISCPNCRETDVSLISTVNVKKIGGNNE